MKNSMKKDFQCLKVELQTLKKEMQELEFKNRSLEAQNMSLKDQIQELECDKWSANKQIQAAEEKLAQDILTSSRKIAQLQAQLVERTERTERSQLEDLKNRNQYLATLIESYQRRFNNFITAGGIIPTNHISNLLQRTAAEIDKNQLFYLYTDVSGIFKLVYEEDFPDSPIEVFKYLNNRLSRILSELSAAQMDITEYYCTKISSISSWLIEQHIDPIKDFSDLPARNHHLLSIASEHLKEIHKLSSQLSKLVRR